MRFDDMLATVLARRPDRPAARIAQWRQLLDIVAQRRGTGEPIDDAVLVHIRAVRAAVPTMARRDAAIAIASRPLDAETIALLIDDVPVVVGAVLSRVALDADGWIAILPRLSPTARGFLRHRRDLGQRVVAALAGFGTTDFVLAGAVATVGEMAPPATPSPSDTPLDTPLDTLPSAEPVATRPQPHEPGAGTGQIRAIISRIASFRNGRDAPPPDDRAEADRTGVESAGFRFETGRDGLIRRVEGIARGPLIGATIAEPATGRYGVDAQAPGAFRRRAPFRDARLTVAGEGPAAGEWRIAGVPVFAPADGRFVGYRGTARRPRDHESAGGAATPAVARPGADGDTMRQLVHELRTPINAIGGFAEMIRRQLRGPVSERYRDRAATIAADAGRLLAAVDDLDLTARLDADRLPAARSEIDVSAMLDDVVTADAGRPLATIRSTDGRVPLVAGDAATIRRMVGRLAGALAAFAEETPVTIAIEVGDAAVTLAFDRPQRLAGLSADELFDPGYDPTGDDTAPLLGLGFTLHLVRRVARAVGGAIAVDDTMIRLRLPRAASAFDVGLA